MESFTETIEIDVPAAAAWAFVADYDRDVEWRADVLEMRADPAGIVVVGTRTHEVLRVGGRTYRSDGVVDTVVPGSCFEWRTTSGAEARGSRTVEPRGAGRCALTLELHVVPHGIDRLLAPMLRKPIARGLRRDLLALEALLGRGEAGVRSLAVV